MNSFAESNRRNSLAYWFPLIRDAGLPVPRTTIVGPMPAETTKAIWEMFDNPGEKLALGENPFFADLRSAAEAMGFPCFLRSAHTSGKHEWERTCFIGSADDVQEHALNIAYFSECVAMMGELPWDTFVIREMLPTRPIGTCPRYGNMPICREFRVFADGDQGELLCSHPYWPLGSLEQGRAALAPGQYEQLCGVTEGDLRAFTEMSVRAAKACGGAWSVDFLETERGWFITDMAEAARSYHWEGCRHADGDAA